jgi:hypothetical protein
MMAEHVTDGGAPVTVESNAKTLSGRMVRAGGLATPGLTLPVPPRQATPGLGYCTGELSVFLEDDQLAAELRARRSRLGPPCPASGHPGYHGFQVRWVNRDGRGPDRPVTERIRKCNMGRARC